MTEGQQWSSPNVLYPRKFLQFVLGESPSFFRPTMSNVITLVCSGSSLSIDHSWNISKQTQPQNILIHLDWLLSAWRRLKTSIFLNHWTSISSLIWLVTDDCGWGSKWTAISNLWASSLPNTDKKTLELLQPRNRTSNLSQDHFNHQPQTVETCTA